MSLSNKLGNFMATGIGSLPYSNPEHAVASVVNGLCEIPFWPQLPMLSIWEGMAGQYIEALPGITTDMDKKSFKIDTSSDLSSEMETFYENFFAENLDYFKITQEHAAGFYEFSARTLPDTAMFVKGHITGPITMGSIIKDEEGKDIMHNEALYDTVIKCLAMKAAWQVRQLEKFKRPVIIFMDEPSMVSFGSAYSTLKKDDVLNAWNEIIDVVHKYGGMVGIHCCGNTEWKVLFDSRCDIVNFDSFEYFEKMMLYIEDVKSFIASGRKLAWGAVPSDNKIHDVTTDFIADKLLSNVNEMSASGITAEDLTANSIITPSCGMGTLDVKSAEKVISTTKEISRRLHDKYCNN